MSSTSEQKPPKPLRSSNVTARIIKQKIWQRSNVENKHFMGAVVGREGHGKSHTAIKIGELVDPTFDADRIMFDPADFLDRLRSSELGAGQVIILDEAGVGMGSRTWYDDDQVLLNQTLQTVRDENMVALFTLPRLTELDSQARGRLHAFIEMVDVFPEEGYAKARWKNIDPTRDDRDKIYKFYPRMRVDGRKKRIRSISFTPPSEDLVSEYEERKAAFKDELYESAIAALRGEDEEEEDADPQEIADELVERGLVYRYVEETEHGQKYFDRDLIEVDYDIGQSKSKKVKKLLKREGMLDEVM